MGGGEGVEGEDHLRAITEKCGGPACSGMYLRSYVE